jgi:hypothetical protein
MELEALPGPMRSKAVDTIAALAGDPQPSESEELLPGGSFRITRENCVIVYDIEAERRCAVISRVRALRAS